MNCRRLIGCAVMSLGLGLGCCMMTLAADPPEIQEQNPRELLALFEMGPSFFAEFKDAEPLSGPEREKLLALVSRLQKIPPAARQHFSLPEKELSTALADPSAARGQFYALSGVVQRVERLPINAELAKRFGRNEWFRCQVKLTDGQAVELIALHLPAAWQLDAPLDERCAAFALFVKLLPTDVAGQHLPLLVTTRLAWQPRNTLGDLGMDAGLFDDVRDRTGLNESEAFYQLLAAVRRAEPGQLERAANEKLTALSTGLEKLVRDPDLDARARANAERSLKRAQQHTSDVVPLFNEPAAQRGKLFALRGEALRAVEVRVSDPDIVRRFGFDHYFEVEIVTLDSANNPIVCCVAELPPGMPIGQSIHENVSVAGFFLKSWAFGTQQTAEQAKSAAEKRRQLAPLLVARTLRLLPAPVPGPEDYRWTLGVVAAFGGLALAWFLLRRKESRAKIQHNVLPDRIVIDDTPRDVKS